MYKEIKFKIINEFQFLLLEYKIKMIIKILLSKISRIKNLHRY